METILCVYFFYLLPIAGLIALSGKLDSNVEKGKYNGIEKRFAQWGASISMAIAVVMMLGGIFYVMGWIWYICGGGLVFVMDDFWDKVIAGIMGAVFCIFIVGGILYALGGK